ncbi:MAG TPA: hypothetical protein ENH62_01455 [Marinobacter sp.]|uniref:Uncharacterized protein n=1 Tax=marine sediment metagenome TaxID=412755 RepID=A0A0F9KRK0_9ZZZZ|nr:hypothetical protein [Marinobacter sp.]
MPEASCPCGLNPSQQGLLDVLLAGNPRRAPSWTRTRYEFIVEYGWWYEPAPRPKGIRLGRKRQCFKNAFNLALDNASLTYCEGFVRDPSGSLLILHAWVTDGHGRAIDNTLREPPSAYAGVPFRTDFLNDYHLRNRAVICLLDDHLHDWPMLGELGDRPEEWLEPKGQGAARLLIGG